MGKAKDLVLRPISSKEANSAVKRLHYSGKVVNNSQLHIGVFYAGKLEGAMQFGPSLDKRKIQNLVADTGWNEFIELNRMAFSDALPRNSESRAIAIAMRLLRNHAPHLKWVVSFADAAQCGDGTIYRASGFVLTGIKPNDQIWKSPNGQTQSRMSLTKSKHILNTGAASMKDYTAAGWRPINGYQLRYLYFLSPEARRRLTVPVLQFDEIDRQGARMYLGKRLQASEGEESSRSATSGKKGGASPTLTLQPAEEM
jgi:hypothetical protein